MSRDFRLALVPIVTCWTPLFRLSLSALQDSRPGDRDTAYILQHSHTEHDTISTKNAFHRIIPVALAIMAIYLMNSTHSKSTGTCTELIQCSATVILHGRRKKFDCATYPKSRPSLPPRCKSIRPNNRARISSTPRAHPRGAKIPRRPLRHKRE